MPDPATMTTALGISRTVLKRADSLLKALLGPAAAEAGELLADRVRLRRFKNQIEILRCADEALRESGLNPREIPLRMLVPLIEHASCEEDTDIQELWANLIASVSTASIHGAIQAVSIQVLSSISPFEAVILRFIHADYLSTREKKLAKLDSRYKKSDVPADFYFYRPYELLKSSGLRTDAERTFLLDNLLRLGILRFDNPTLEGGEVSDPDHVQLTELGLAVIKACVGGPDVGAS